MFQGSISSEGHRGFSSLGDSCCRRPKMNKGCSDPVVFGEDVRFELSNTFGTGDLKEVVKKESSYATILLSIFHDDPQFRSPNLVPGCHHITRKANDPLLPFSGQGRDQGHSPATVKVRQVLQVFFRPGLSWAQEPLVNRIGAQTAKKAHQSVFIIRTKKADAHDFSIHQRLRRIERPGIHFSSLQDRPIEMGLQVSSVQKEIDPRGRHSARWTRSTTDQYTNGFSISSRKPNREASLFFSGSISLVRPMTGI